jgi:hypothetical protein
MGRVNTEMLNNTVSGGIGGFGGGHHFDTERSMQMEDRNGLGGGMII